MEYQVYLDVLFFWNFCLDCLIIHQTGLLLKANSGKRQVLRTVLAGAVGAAGSCLVTLLYGLPLFLKLFLTIPLLSVLMVWIGFFGGRVSMKKRRFVRQYLTFLGNTLLLEDWSFFCNIVFIFIRFLRCFFPAVSQRLEFACT